MLSRVEYDKSFITSGLNRGLNFDLSFPSSPIRAETDLESLASLRIS